MDGGSRPERFGGAPDAHPKVQSISTAGSGFPAGPIPTSAGPTLHIAAATVAREGTASTPKAAGARHETRLTVEAGRNRLSEFRIACSGRTRHSGRIMRIPCRSAGHFKPHSTTFASTAIRETIVPTTVDSSRPPVGV